MSKIDLNRVWDDARSMGSANKDLLAAICGMFVMLPLVLTMRLVSVPEGRLDAKATEQSVTAWYTAFVEANWYLLLACTLLLAFGTLAMLTLLLRQERPTVAESLKGALFVLPSYMVASMVQNLALQLGAILFFVPAFYLTGRFALIAAVAAAEQEYNPITIIQRSFALTRRNGWRIFGVLAVIFLALSIAFLVLFLLTGILSSLFLPPDLAALVVQLVGGLMFSVMVLVTILVSAALYRVATTQAPAPWVPGAGG